MTVPLAVANAQQRILATLSVSGQEAVLFATLQRDLALDQRTAADALRGLMETGRVVLRRASGSGSGSDASVYVALSNTMHEGPSRVLDVIRLSGNCGIDQPTLYSKVRLPRAEINKALQLLLDQKRIKERRCFTNRAKRIYLLFEFEPSDEVTGGTFYSGDDAREMDVAFIDDMRRRIVALVHVRLSVSLEQIVQHLQEAHSTAGAPVIVSLRPRIPVPVPAPGANSPSTAGKRITARDAQVLAHSLVLDGVLECVEPSLGAPAQYQLAVGRSVMRHFTAVRSMCKAEGDGGPIGPTGAEGPGPGPGLGLGVGRWVPAPVSARSAWAMPAAGLPCLGCPQLPVCSASGAGVINPRTCAYMNEWLS